MNDNYGIGIIGYGYVGSAVGHLCESNNLQFSVCDKLEKSGKFEYFNNIGNMITSIKSKNYCRNYYFIAVPTPSDITGACDTSILDQVIENISCYTTKQKDFVIIKSTITPGTSRILSAKYKSVNIIFCPEFLTEKNYLEDMYNANFVIVSNEDGRDDSEGTGCLFKRLYSHKSIDIFYKTYEEAEIFKYSLNVYFAVKVWYFNEIYEICDQFGIDYQNLKSMYSLDSRIGNYGIQVPGHDGKFSFGGTCLPKETRGMIHLQKSLGLPNKVLKELMERSDFLRNKPVVSNN